MSSYAGRSALIGLALAACTDDPDVHLAVTRMTSQEVGLVVCDPANSLCKNRALFAATDAVSTVKTIDIEITDDTPTLVIRFQFLIPNFCTQVTVTPTGKIDARVTLPTEAIAPAIEGCGAACDPEACPE